MKIELSLSKLLHNNNFLELEDSDFYQTVALLHQALYEMGVEMSVDKVINAYVSSIHFSKNILLTDYLTAYYCITEISKSNLSNKLDINRTDFRNGGQSIKYHANSYEIVFYDKIKDLQQAKISGKRAEENENEIQLNVLDPLSNQKPLEVLRMEVRLNTRQKIRSVLKEICVKVEPTFNNLFSQNLSKKILLHYLNEVEAGYPPILRYQNNSPAKAFDELLIANPHLNPNQALKLLGLQRILNEIGTRGFRESIERFGTYYWYSLNKEMKQLKKIESKDIFSVLRDALNKFEPIKLLAKKEEMINNDKYE
ncbi:hypothetical protein CO178_00695 [candidate division WWE3 bacterium CG_4_9_14_3_um_filter_34_6]|uniref:Uncharacterized protein n=1 Tax=candidate division WWE3 bacterium CG_4_9_14_3_um_filter_34_6 TaxID=1975079 RepID=A0A2M7X4W4_UNCKA|nr:MAG: hypothetical protein CO178_00695 [candidate division WWE3 bacterium CG_4_9_14_3_um_filter_34_6]